MHMIPTLPSDSDSEKILAGGRVKTHRHKPTRHKPTLPSLNHLLSLSQTKNQI
jgi:hypothetical protein